MAKLLTVEDETAIRELLAFICETDGHEVVKAASLAEAREALRRGGLDLILLDVMLPDGSGFDFLREVRTDAASASVPVVMITARGDEADRVEGLDAGADDYVVKPFMPRELTARIRAVLRRASAEGRARESAVPPADDRQEEIVRCGPLLMNETRFEATADGMRRDFVANVSHELRTPLTVIAGFLDLADMDVPPELRKRHLALMRDQTARMKRLTDDLLMLSKLENRDERGTDQPELIDMSALIDDAVREGMAYSKMQHKFEVAHEPLSLLGHPEEIRSAVLNLITNAVRYTPRGGRIRVVWKRTGTGAVLTVADTGIGIPPEHLPRITERFYRVDKGRSRDTGGTGLGLAIVKHVMRRAGGELSIESTPGEGSKFMLRFPEERIFSGRYL